MIFFFSKLKKLFSKKISRSFSAAAFCVFSSCFSAWGTVYLYDSGITYSYSGSETDYDAITAEFSSTPANFNIEASVDLASMTSTDVFIVTSASSFDAGTNSDNNGTLVNYGTVSGSFTNNGIVESMSGCVFSADIVNSGSFNCTRGAVTFTGSMDSSGGLLNCDTVTVSIYNNTTAQKTWTLPSSQVLGTVYTGGNVTFDLNGPCTIQEFYVPNGTNAGTYAIASDWNLYITGTGPLEVTDTFDLNRFSTTSDVAGYIHVETDTSFTGTAAAQLHVGSNLLVAASNTFSAGSLYVSSFSNDVITSVQVNGSLTVTDTLDLGALGNPCCGKLSVASSGLVNADKILWTATVYRNAGDSEPFVNNGTVNVGTSLDVIASDASGTSLAFTNNGTVNISDNASVEAAGFNGSSSAEINFLGSGQIYAVTPNFSGKINLPSGTYFESWTGSLSSIELAVSTGETVTFSGLSTVQNAVAADSVAFVLGGTSVFQTLKAENLGGKTVSFTGALNVNTLSLTGTSETSRLHVTGASGSSITLPSDQTGGKFLEIENVAISSSTYTATKSIPANGISVPTGWIIDMLFKWTGATDTDWDTGSNWDFGIVPFDGSSVEIPYVANQPVLASAVELNDVTIDANCSLTLAGNNMTVNGDWSNDGTIYLYGTETLVFDKTSSDNGTWNYFRSAPDTSGSLKEISNFSFNYIVLEGSGNFGGGTVQSSLVTIKEIYPSGGGATFSSTADTEFTSTSIVFDTATTETTTFSLGSHILSFGGNLTGTGNIAVNGSGSFEASLGAGESGSYFGDITCTGTCSCEFGSAVYVSSISTGSGTSIFRGPLTSSSFIDVNGASYCYGNVTADTSISFAGNSVFGTAVTAVKATDSSSTIEFDGTVSGTALTFTANSITVKKNVTTSGNQIYAGELSVGGSGVTLRSTGGRVTASKNITLSGSCSVIASGVCTLHGVTDSGTSSEFSASGSSIYLYAYDYITGGKQTYTGRAYVNTDTAGSYTWKGGGDGIVFAGSNDLFLNYSASTISLESNLTAYRLYFYNGNLSLSGVQIYAKNRFVVLGAACNVSDPRFYTTNTRFRYADFSTVSGTAAFTVLSNAVFRMDGSFYDNGADLGYAGSSLKIILPSNADSTVRFSAASDAEYGTVSGASCTQWGNLANNAVVFNCTVQNVTVECSASGGSAYIAAASGSLNQNVTDGGNNTSVSVDAAGNPSSLTGFQFLFPEITKAYTVYDDVLCLEFSMPIENSHDEIARALSYVTSLTTGGVWYNGGTSAFGGAYSDADCTTAVSTSASKIMKIYLKINSSSDTWNTDATGTSSGNTSSTDRNGNSRSVVPDVSMLEGVFSAEYGHTMCANYGTNSVAAFTEAEDHCQPVLVGVSIGQELHSENNGTASSQEYYDAHNFIEFVFSEPVDIGSLLHDGEDQNVQATASLGEVSNNASGFTVAGLASFSSGIIDFGTRGSGSPHALYRKFSTTVGGTDQAQPFRIRLSVAGLVDGSFSYGTSTFHNWPGFINSSLAPSGAVTRFSNTSITDLATDNSGNDLKNTLDNGNGTVNHVPSILNVSTTVTELYGAWDSSNPVFAVYVDDLNTAETGWDWMTLVSSAERQYEVIGSTNSNSATYLDNLEIHIFDNTPLYSSSDSYKWASMNGWTSGGTVLSGFDAPESAGGSRGFSSSANRTSGGIRRSSLAGAVSAFSYSYNLEGSQSSIRAFDSTEISQDVKSALFRTITKTENNTKNDGLYLKLALNPADVGILPIKTTFTVIYSPSSAYITDLAGNRIVETDTGSSVKTVNSIDITPPSFSMCLSPIGENKIYMIFTKPLAYDGTYLNDLSPASLASALEKIQTNLEFVYSLSDNKDTTDVCTDLSVESVSLATPDTLKYTALLLNLNRAVSLTDIEKTWIRISNTVGLETVTTIFGTDNASPIQDRFKNGISLHTCHSISDFALNAVDVLYAYADSTEGDEWNEQGIYGKNFASSTDNYAVHNFYADAGKSGTLKTGNDIVFQVRFVGGKRNGEYFTPENDETFSVIADCKDNLKPSWISDKFNRFTGKNWRIWLTSQFNTLASSYNTNDVKIISEIENVSGSSILKNFTFENSLFNFGNKLEYQFIFKIHDSSGNDILINYDGDNKIPLYALWMPSSYIQSGNFSFIDLWSFVTRDIVQQRGGVTILNNVIDSKVKEQTVVEVVMPKRGNLNIYVMTLDGNIVKRLSKGKVDAGTHYYRWDGTNNSGKSVARGMYFVRVVGPEIDETRKVMVVKE